MTKIYDLFEDEDHIADWCEYTQNIVGIGGFSAVYNVPKREDLVLKVTEDEPYLIYLDLVKNIDTPHKPIIHDQIEINGAMYILTERLYFIKDEDVAYLDERACEVGWWEHDTQPWGGLSKSFDYLLDVLDKEFNRRWDSYYDRVYFDLRDTNIMQREDGTLVITDPFSVESYVGG